MVKINTDNIHKNDTAGALKGVKGAKGAKHERAEKTGGTVPAGEVKAAREKDKVELSGKSAEVGKLVDQLKQLPDVRQDRVNEIKQKIASGSCGPSSEDIADAILKDE